MSRRRDVGITSQKSGMHTATHSHKLKENKDLKSETKIRGAKRCALDKNIVLRFFCPPPLSTTHADRGTICVSSPCVCGQVPPDSCMQQTQRGCMCVDEEAEDGGYNQHLLRFALTDQLSSSKRRNRRRKPKYS